jgi:hypothetical protein
MNDTQRRFFFVHIMKTGGTTLRRHMEHNFPAPGALYPDERIDGDASDANMLIQPLLAQPAARHEQVRAYLGHFPWIVSRLVDPSLVTLTVLREPVGRTVSYLQHCQAFHGRHEGLSLEAIYEDAFTFPTLIHDHQTKIFSMAATDRLESYMDVIDVDDDRLRAARDNLATVDLVGLQEDYDAFLRALSTRYGWEILPRKPWMASAARPEITASFRRRIEADNARDVELYDYARRLVAERAG